MKVWEKENPAWGISKGKVQGTISLKIDRENVPLKLKDVNI